MADGSYRFQQGAGQYYYSQYNQQPHPPRHLQRTGSPVNNHGIPFTTDTPSPTRTSAVSSGPASFSMYTQSHPQQGQHGMMNGSSSHPRFGMHMNLGNKYQHQSQHNQTHQQHHDHGGHSTHSGNFPNHQHTISSGGLSNATPHFAPSHLTNGTPNSVNSGLSKPPNEHWALQLQLVQRSREMTMAHPYARNHPSVNKSVISGITTNSIAREGEKEERNRATENTSEAAQKEQVWSSIDLGGQNLKAISIALFDYTFLTKLYVNCNKLSYIPAAIGRLRNLVALDLSLNNVSELPPEIGMLVNLKEFFLFDNNLRNLPYELGSLYQLEILGIEGNPLDDDLKSVIVEQGTMELVKYLRERYQGPEPPRDRDWIVIDDSEHPAQDKFTVLSYNTLCDKYATQSQYGYTPTGALAWDRRRAVILDELRERDSDILCLQEIDSDSFNDYFRGALAHNDYKGVFWPKSRARTMNQEEAKFVDGCATFYKNNKFILLDKQLIDFANIAINRPDMKGEHEIFNRVMPRDNIAVVAFFENRQTGARLIVVNAHVYWDPAFKDVKVVQVAILMEQITKLADKYAKWPPCTDKVLYKFTNGDKESDKELEETSEPPAPSMDYAGGAQIPLVMCGDFNSTPDSGVYDLIAHGSLSHTHSDLGNRKYGNFTRDGMTHPFSLRSSYSHVNELPFTNYTPGFTGVIDYIWYSTNALAVTSLLGQVDEEYLRRVPGFPNYHFPSDHLALLTEFYVKARKDKKKIPEADFGSQKDRR